MGRGWKAGGAMSETHLRELSPEGTRLVHELLYLPDTAARAAGLPVAIRGVELHRDAFALLDGVLRREYYERGAYYLVLDTGCGPLRISRSLSP